MSLNPSGQRRFRFHRARTASVASVVVALTVAGGLLGPASPATAAPKPDIATVRKQVEQLQQEAEEATERYNATREKMASLSVRISAANTRVAQQRKQVGVARARLGRIAAETYKAGDLQALRVFLDDDPAALLAAGGLRDALTDRQAEAVAQLVAAQNRLAADQGDLTDQQAKLAASSSELSVTRKQVLAKLSKARQLLSQLDGSQRRALLQVGRSLDRKALAKLGIEVPPNGVLRCTDVGIDAPNARAAAAIDFACDQLGKPYVWGGSGPGTFDCSGLTMQAWGHAGVSLPHNAAMQAQYGNHVSESQLQPGDLLFFHGYGHMGMYIGKGLMVHAPHTGDVVRIAPARFGQIIDAVRL